jgi:diazepam-binding inhibitor (GABA receptor modulator, acyl-CoA-binding protein)
MADLKTQFEAAAKLAQSLAKRPDNDTLLQIYALYKQSTGGDASGARPGMLDPVGRAKFDAWAKLKGTGKEAAMQRYVDLINKLNA